LIPEIDSILAPGKDEEFGQWIEVSRRRKYSLVKWAEEENIRDEKNILSIGAENITILLPKSMLHPWSRFLVLRGSLFTVSTVRLLKKQRNLKIVVVSLCQEWSRIKLRLLVFWSLRNVLERVK
jgi:hypothetical protein